MTRSVQLRCGAIIDADDVARIPEAGWYVPVSGGWKGYACYTTNRFGRKKTFALHRVIMRAIPGELIDHVNGNTLDCRKSNLRRANKKINAYNMRKSPNQKRGLFKGVFRNRSKRNPWRAQIARTEPDGKLRQYSGGVHATPEAAARAYDKLARKLFGPAAALNFPRSR